MDKLLVADMRKPWYNLVDGLWGLASTDTVLNDPELKAKVETIRRAMVSAEMHMTENYRWD